MLKKLLLTTTGLCFACTSALYAQQTEEPVEFNIYGEFNSYYKNQTDYQTPLDYPNSVRHGANNRSSQNARANTTLTLVAKAGKQTSGGKDWYQFIGVTQIVFDANDPDHPDTYDSTSTDPGGSPKARSRAMDSWIRYSPHISTGIKIGRQTPVATSNAASTYIYEGDFEDDFRAYYAATTLRAVDGISVDVHLSEEVELGLGKFNGMGDGSELATQGSSHQADNNVLWFQGAFDGIKVNAAYQSIAVGGLEDEEDGNIPNVYKKEHKHTIQNLAVSTNLGIVTPYIGYQMISGDSAAEMSTGQTTLSAGNKAIIDGVTAASPALGSLLTGDGLTELSYNTDQERDMELSIITLGVIAELGPGTLALDYTKISTKEYGEKGYVPVGLNLDSSMQLNYAYPVAKDATITFFYHSLTAREDDGYKTAIDEATSSASSLNKNAATIDAATGGAVSAATLTALADSNTAYAAALEKNLGYTNSTSIGVSFKMKFSM